MKTLKGTRSGSFFDFTKNASGRLVSLDSSTFEGRDEITDQRLVKAVLSGRYLFEPNYGAGIKSFIGQKKSPLQIIQRIDDLNAFFQKYSSVSLGLSIKKVIASLRGESILVSIQTVPGSFRKILFEKESSDA